ncbi:MAG: DUF3102 domain-containing protein [Candidatus Ventricola sp.]
MSLELSTLRERVKIETRMEACRDAAASNLVEIGALLNRAKDGGLVPHGEWREWVQEHAGMNERTAQRVMRIARELPAGSPLASLGVAKLSALLTLPEGEREDAAREMDAEHLTSREVEERVRAIRQERDEALRLVGEQKRRMTEIVDDRDAAIERAVTAERRVQEAARQQEIDEAVQKARVDAQKDVEERLRDGTKAIWDKASESYAERLAAARSRIDALEAHIVDARAQGKADAAQEMGDRLAAQKREYARLEEQAMAQARELADVKSRLLDAQQKRPDEDMMRLTVLKDEAERRCRRAEQEIDRLSEELDQARTDALRAGCSAGADRQSPVTLILSAIGALMAEAGNAPGELSRTAGLDEATGQLLIGQAQLVGQWAMSIIAACGGETHA